MWLNDNRYTVPTEERLHLNNLLETAYRERGVSFEIDSEGIFVPAPYLACMVTNPLTKKFNFHCGVYWNELNNILPVIAMTHELGHYVDVKQNFDLDLFRYMETLGTNEMEVRAWLYAVEICKEMNFNHWSVFFRYAQQCLLSYFSEPYHWNDLRVGFNGVSPTIEDAKERLKTKIEVPFEEEVPDYMKRRQINEARMEELLKMLKL